MILDCGKLTIETKHAGQNDDGGEDDGGGGDDDNNNNNNKGLKEVF